MTLFCIQYSRRIRVSMSPPMKIDEAYRVLEIEPGATAEQVKAAYRLRALASHPDKGGDAATFQRVSEAFQVLRAFEDHGEGYRAHVGDTDADDVLAEVVRQMMAEMDARQREHERAERAAWLHAMMGVPFFSSTRFRASSGFSPGGPGEDEEEEGEGHGAAGQGRQGGHRRRQTGGEAWWGRSQEADLSKARAASNITARELRTLLEEVCLAIDER